MIAINFFFQVPGTKHSALWNNICFTSQPHWINREPTELSENVVLHCYFRFQHTKPLTACKVVRNSEGLTMILRTKLRAITEGQFAVLYRDGECLGSAKIMHICHNL